MINIRHIINSINSNLVVSGKGNFWSVARCWHAFCLRSWSARESSQNGTAPDWAKDSLTLEMPIEPFRIHYWYPDWWFRTFFFHILGIMIQTDFHIFQRGRSTTNQYLLMSVDWILSGIEKGYTPGSRAFHVSMALHWRHWELLAATKIPRES